MERIQNSLNRKLELLGWTSYQTYVFFAAGLGWSIDNMWIIALSIIMEEAGAEWNLSQTEKSFISMTFMVGMLIGSYLWGFSGDKFGRVKIFKFTALITWIASACSVFTPNYEILALCILFVGIGVGGDITLGGTIVNEYFPLSKGWTLTLLCGFWYFGASLSAILALVILKTGIGRNFGNWRIVVLIETVLIIAYWIFRQFLKETPKYLITSGNMEEADRVVHHVTYNQMSNNSNALLFETFLSTQYRNQQDYDKVFYVPSKSSPVTALFNKENFKTTILLTLSFFNGQIGCIAIYFFMPLIIKNTSIEFTLEESYTIMMLQQLSSILATVLSAYLVTTRLGRVYTFSLFFIIAGISGLSLIFATSKILFFTSSTIVGFSMGAGWAAGYTLNAELYPTYVRSTAMGWGSAVQKVGGIVTPGIVSAIVELGLGEMELLAFIGGSLSLCGIVGMFMRETSKIE